MRFASLAPILRFVLTARGWPSQPATLGLATHLPAVPCAGLEFSLIDDGRIDLQQRVRGPRETRRLLHVARAASASPSWRRVAELCGADDLREIIDEVWLELDDTGPAAAPALSVFVRLSPAIDVTAYSETLAIVLAALQDRRSPEQQGAIARGLAALSGGGTLSHVGVMLGRPGVPLALVIDDLPATEIASCACAAGWTGSSATLARDLDRIFVHVDRVRLVLTVRENIAPALGLECFVGAPGVSEPRWKGLLDTLVAAGLCRPAMRDRVLAWPGVLTPVSTGDEWPESLIVGALARDPRDVGRIECRISHLKLAYEQDRITRAKAYLGFVEVWDDTVPRPPIPSRPAVEAHASDGGSIARGVRFLLAARAQAGWWLDYAGFAAGVSDEWVTAYVAHALSEMDEPDACRAARRAWTLLAGRPRQGWGWNHVQPADADSTAWGLRLAAKIGELASPRAQVALRFLHQHLRQGGGVATYDAAHYQGWLDGVTLNPEWCKAHVCVTAAVAALAPMAPGPLAFLRSCQAADGSWSGYWWADSAYATTLAMESLALDGAEASQPHIASALAWNVRALDSALTSARTSVESPFDIALMLRALLIRPAGHDERIERAVQALDAAQRDDGSWEGSARLAIRLSDGQSVAACDTGRTLTTATVVAALHRARATRRG
jgi:hypothetical protein